MPAVRVVTHTAHFRSIGHWDHWKSQGSHRVGSHSWAGTRTIASRRLTVVMMTRASAQSERDCQDPREVPPLPKGSGAIGSASVSKTDGWGFESLLPCGAWRVRAAQHPTHVRNFW